MNCSKKRAFHTKAEAKRTLGRVQSIRRNERQVKRVYRCPHCGEWHLTSELKVAR